jgi:DNA-binding MarR family transcriptional regulator
VATTHTHAPVFRALPGLLLGKLGRGAYNEFTEALKPIELTPRHLGALFMLRQQGPMSQQALLEAVGVDPSKLVGVLNDLEEDGLILRRRDPVDRRRHIVEISAEGEAKMQAAEEAVRAVDERLLAGLDEDDRARLFELLRRIAENLGQERCAELGAPGPEELRHA